MHNPYDGINWSSIYQIVSTTHDHVLSDDPSINPDNVFRNLYNAGVRCFAVSNYYPSEPMYPLSDFLTLSIPDDVIEVPNAEHHNFQVKGYYGNQLHMNSLGSTFSSGKIRGETPIGYHGKVENFVKEALRYLLFEDAGGLTVNHPTWTRLHSNGGFPDDLFIYILDLDERVLGIEIFNTDTYDLDLWDNILSTGRKCFGFAAPDHQAKYDGENWMGRSVLLVQNKSQYDCLKAFRDGSFYAKIRNTPLYFNDISISEETLRIGTTIPSTIRFIADGSIVSEVENVNSASYQLTGVETYIRAEAETTIDRIFTQPIMMYVKPRKNKKIKNRIIETIYSI